ncbi:hypothetical protein [Actinocrispum wychmicini]|uniref:Uncharacterized protein n=1 Tax=Actinocrispum wychmicini TaxID=1213861 RepID=A0A4R2IRI0_9PSEU|nr:hypothetical protein [Actinocrispum wychmicini]TCO47292.1 hypothetical protein EV192_11732 [Actinocrispum wychmicini]
MLSTGTPALDDALAEALAQPVREPVWRLLVDLARDGRFAHPWSDVTSLATDITVDRAITGDLPEGTTLTEGYASASLTASLEGRFSDGTSIVDAVASKAGNPSWVGVSLRYDLGLRTRLGPVLLRQFTGIIRTTSMRASSGSVDITAADGAEQLRAGITLPSISLDGLQQAKYGDSGYRYWMNSQWIIDYVLRANGILTAAAPMPGCVLTISGHGSLVSEVGFGGQPIGTTDTYTGPLWTSGPDGMLAPNGGDGIPTYTSRYTAAGMTPVRGGAGFGMALWVYHGAGAPLGGGVSTSRVVEVVPGGNQIFSLVLQPNGGIAISTVPGGTGLFTVCPITLDATVRWRQIAAHIAFTGTGGGVSGFTVTWNVDGQIATSSTNRAMVSGGEYPSALVNLYVARPLSGVQVWVLPTAPAPDAWPKLPATPPGDIDPGLNQLTYFPAITGRDSWELIKEVAQAEFGVPGFNESGRFSFLNRDTLTSRRSAPPTATLTADQLAEVTATTSMDSVRNDVSITAASAYTRNPKVLIESTDPLSYVFAAGTLERRVLALPEGSSGLVGLFGSFNNGSVVRVASSAWNDTVLTGYACVRADQPATEVTSNVSIVVRRLTATSAQASFSNTNTFPIQLTTNDATPRPAFRLSGAVVTPDPPLTDILTDDTSIATYRRRSLDLGSGPWRQRLDPFRALAQTLLAELARPSTVYDRIPLPGDPRRTLTDTVTVTYPATVTASIIGITRRLSTTDGLVDELTVRPQHP